MGATHAPVLLVNDVPDEREMYAEYLQQVGYTTIEAGTAEDGYRLAAELRPRVVVTDLMLPGETNGLDLVRRLKRGERTRRVPVIMLTGCVFDVHRTQAERAGVDLFIGKPCLPNELVRQIRLLIARGRMLRAHPGHSRGHGKKPSSKSDRSHERHHADRRMRRR